MKTLPESGKQFLQTLSISEESKTLIAGIAEELVELVRSIESKPKTTQNHYGDYMGILGQFPDKIKLTSIALIVAGANKQGVIDAAGLYGATK